MLIKNFTRVHDAVGIQKFFDLFHQGEAFAMLFLYKLFLSDSNSLSATLPYSMDEYSTSQLFFHFEHQILCFFYPLSLMDEPIPVDSNLLLKRPDIFFYSFL